MRAKIFVGDTLDFVTDAPNFPASGGWTLNYRLVPFVTGNAIEIVAATYEVDRYRVQVPNTDTANWAVGKYSWAAYVTKGAGERYTVANGQTELLPNPHTTSAPLDTRSHPRKVLDAVMAVIENRASSSQRDLVAYTIGSRSQQFDQADTKASLLELKSKYEWFVANEDARESLAAGKPNPRNVRIRFGAS